MLAFQDEGNFEFTKNIVFKNYFTEKKQSTHENKGEPPFLLYTSK